MSSVLMTSTMKSQPGTPPTREADNSFGVPISAAATCAVGGSAEGIRGAAPVEALVAALAGGTAVAPLATATPPRTYAGSPRHANVYGSLTSSLFMQR